MHTLWNYTERSRSHEIHSCALRVSWNSGLSIVYALRASERGGRFLRRIALPNERWEMMKSHDARPSAALIPSFNRPFPVEFHLVHLSSYLFLWGRQGKECTAFERVSDDARAAYLVSFYFPMRTMSDCLSVWQAIVLSLFLWEPRMSFPQLIMEYRNREERAHGSGI